MYDVASPEHIRLCSGRLGVLKGMAIVLAPSGNGYAQDQPVGLLTKALRLLGHYEAAGQIIPPPVEKEHQQLSEIPARLQPGICMESNSISRYTYR
nr:hypothetical protein CFP56_09490 [Quercus suber]